MTFSSPLPCQTVAWQHAVFQIPADWEVTGYLIHPEEGELHFATREGIQAEWHWRRCSSVPDIARIMTEIHRRHLAKTDPEQAKVLTTLPSERVGRFLFVYHRPGEMAQAALFLPEKALLFQWIFPVYDRCRLEQVWRPLLQSFEENDRSLRQWAIFGIDLCLPPEYEIEALEPFPANVTLRFVTRNHRKVRVRRLGLPSFYLQDHTLEDFYRLFLWKQGCKILDSTSREIFGLPGAFVTFEERGAYGFDKLIGRWWKGEGWIWYDEDAMRLYALEQVGPPHTPPVDLATTFSRGWKQNLISRWNPSTPVNESPSLGSASPTQAKKRRKQLSFEDQLYAIPVRNERVQILSSSEHSLQIAIERRYGPILRWVARFLPLSKHRRCELDGLALFLYQQIDGKRRVEDLIRDLASQYRLTFFESRALILHFLHAFMEKGLVIVAVPSRAFHPFPPQTT